MPFTAFPYFTQQKNNSMTNLSFLIFYQNTEI